MEKVATKVTRERTMRHIEVKGRKTEISFYAFDWDNLMDLGKAVDIGQNLWLANEQGMGLRMHSPDTGETVVIPGSLYDLLKNKN